MIVICSFVTDSIINITQGLWSRKNSQCQGRQERSAVPNARFALASSRGATYLAILLVDWERRRYAIYNIKVETLQSWYLKFYFWYYWLFHYDNIPLKNGVTGLICFMTSPALPSVWFLGHSYMFLATQRADCRPGGRSFGFRNVEFTGEAFAGWSGHKCSPKLLKLAGSPPNPLGNPRNACRGSMLDYGGRITNTNEGGHWQNIGIFHWSSTSVVRDGAQGCMTKSQGRGHGGENALHS